MPAASVIVPYVPGEPYRDAAWRWNEKRWRELFPDYELIVESPGHRVDGPEMFPHPKAINRGVARSTGDVVIVCDCDTAADAAWLRSAVESIRAGEMVWAMAEVYDKFTEEASALLLERDPGKPIPQFGLEIADHIDGVSWGGLTVSPRWGFETVRGYDLRFRGWGSDDVAFGLSMDTLVGRHTRIPGSRIVHFWHPQNPQVFYGHKYQFGQQQLTERYIEAAGDVEMMRGVRFG